MVASPAEDDADKRRDSRSEEDVARMDEIEYSYKSALF